MSFLSKVGTASVLLAIGCLAKSPVSPTPPHIPDIDWCGRMCDHIGPKGLKCPEGEPYYDSDKEGPKGEPNTSCEEFCQTEQNQGIYINPRCVAQAPTCGDIEEYRRHYCNTAIK